MTETSQLGSIANTRTEAQRKHMEGTIGKGTCPFCVIDRKINIPIRRSRFWRVWFNPFPYPNHKAHIVIALKRHETKICKLKGPEWVELIRIHQWAVRKYNLPGGALVMRFGDIAFNAGTLTHIHLHIQVPDGTHTVIAVFSKGPAWPDMLKLLLAEK